MRSVPALGLDLSAVVVFVTIGRANHEEGGGLGGFVTTLWPFLVALAAGWLVARAWRRPAEVVPAGVLVWVLTVGVGMLLRGVSGQGTAAAFVLVATLFLGAELLGWRGAAALVRRRRTSV